MIPSLPHESMRVHMEGEYRCSACGHGERLQACAEGVIAGMLQPDGEVTQDDVSQSILCEDSIECIDHQDSAELERWFDGHWTRWRHCDWKDGAGKRCVNGSLTYFDRRIGRCEACDGAGGFNAPVDPAAPRERQNHVDE